MSIVLKFPLRAGRTETVTTPPGLSALTSPVPVTVAANVPLVALVRALRTEGMLLSYDPSSRVMLITMRKADETL